MIKDKLIKDFIEITTINYDFHSMKANLKDMGYEVEKEKSEFEKYEEEYTDIFNYYAALEDTAYSTVCTHLRQLNELHEQAIEEEINKHKRCKTCAFNHNPARICDVRCRNHSHYELVCIL